MKFKSAKENVKICIGTYQNGLNIQLNGFYHLKYVQVHAPRYHSKLLPMSVTIRCNFMPYLYPMHQSKAREPIIESIHMF